MRNLSWLLLIILLRTSPGVAQDAAGIQEESDSTGRRPVLLVPGWMGRSLDMMALKERFVRDGWPEKWVIPLEFRDPVGSSRDHASELIQALNGVLEETGAPAVDIIAHSMGGLAVWVLLQETEPSLPINRVVFLATPFQGTVTAYLAWGAGGPEMIPENTFLRELQRRGWPQRWVAALAIRTPLDLTVVPGQGASLMGIGDQVVCCPTHQGLLDHEETYQVIRDFLIEMEKGGEGIRPR